MPTLFLLYTEPIYRLGDVQVWSGYADDVATLCFSDSVEATVAEAIRKINELVAWGAANGIAFDSDKTEVMHFSRRPTRAMLAVRHGDQEKRPGKALQWLGIWLDPTLSFKTHVRKWMAKAWAVAYHLKGLTNTKHRLLPAAVRQAVQACVVPVLLHGAEVWYPGITCPSWAQPSTEVSLRIKGLIQRMDVCLCQANGPSYRFGS